MHIQFAPQFVGANATADAHLVSLPYDALRRTPVRTVILGTFSAAPIRVISAVLQSIIAHPLCVAFARATAALMRVTWLLLEIPVTDRTAQNGGIRWQCRASEYLLVARTGFATRHIDCQPVTPTPSRAETPTRSLRGGLKLLAALFANRGEARRRKVGDVGDNRHALASIRAVFARPTSVVCKLLAACGARSSQLVLRSTGGRAVFFGTRTQAREGLTASGAILGDALGGVRLWPWHELVLSAFASICPIIAQIDADLYFLRKQEACRVY